MTDFLLLEKMHRMISELTKPRLMYRKGISVRGFFRPYMSFSDYTMAAVFRNIDEITPVTVRFASMLGDKGTADTVRNIKGMNVKFHSTDGIYDMICRSIPVMFINDEAKIFDISRAFMVREYFDGVNSAEFWDFITENPEAVNCALRFFSYEGLSDSYIYIKWFSENLVIWQNSKGEKFLIKYKWLPVVDENTDVDMKKPDRIAAEFMAGFDSDRASNELEAAIGNGKFPVYELYIQMINYDKVSDTSYTSRTLIWDEDEAPPVAAGVMKLTGLVEDRRKQCDLLGFAPGNTVEGIELYRDDLAELENYLYKIEALERGGEK